MRTFRHLTKAEISEIILCHVEQTANQAELAVRFNVDPSTISYHITKYERAYPEEAGVYAVLKARARKVCIHPSGRCTLCGQMWDELRRKERAEIEQLRVALEVAHATLRSAGYDVESVPYNGVDDTN